MHYFHRIDPNISADGARRCIDAARADLAKLRPKARSRRQSEIELMELDLMAMESRTSSAK